LVDDNGGVDLARDSERLILAARRPLATRNGRIALVLALAATAALEVPNSAQGDRSSAVVLNVLAVLPLMAARRFPLLSTCGTTLVTCLILGTRGAAVTVTVFGVLLYAVGQLVARRGVLIAVPLIVPFLVHAVSPLDGGDPGLLSSVPLFFVVTAMLVGALMRERSEVVTELDATQAAMAESVREQTAMEERAHIAREMHDIVAHHLSVIAVQSETARLTSAELSPDARVRFEAIAATARQALTETRRLLGVLRQDAGGDAERTPQPGFEQFNDLIDAAREAGANIRVIREGMVTELPPGIDVAAYRIVQEALTNARRHAPGAAVDVEVCFRDDVLHLRVRDYGPGPVDGEPTMGHGLIGMRDRATVAGGTLCYRAAEGTGFEVDATLPTSQGAA
jgi:signal transduction histidine kinase